MNFLWRAGKINIKTYIAFGAAAAAILGGYFAFRGGDKTIGDFTEAKRANLVQEVSVTGKVEPLYKVELSFDTTGKIAGVAVSIGQNIVAGSRLVWLDSSELETQLRKAEADLSVGQAELEKTRLLLANYYAMVPSALNDAYTKANDAIREKLDDLFSDDEKNPLLSFGVKVLQIKNDAEFGRLRATAELNAWLKELQNLDTSPDSLDAYLSRAKTRLEEARRLLDLALTAVIESTTLSATTASAYINNINSGRASINTALSSVISAEQNISAQKASIISQEASIKSQRANAETIKAQMAKTAIFAPISGTITKQDAKVGQVAAVNEKLISIASTEDLKIEANVPEADIAKLRIGNIANITLDAYGGDEVFEATLTSIDPSATLIEGVPTYKITLNFRKKDARIKPGMTANIDIVTASKENVIIVPQRAIITRNGEKFVLVDAELDEPEERRVETGLRGSDGNIEIISGLREGERVSTFGKL